MRDTWGWLAADESRSYYLDQSGWLQCFNLHTEQPLWSRVLGETSSAHGYVVPLDNKVLVGGWRGYTRLMCLDSGTGETLWTYPDRVSFNEPVVTSLGIALVTANPTPGHVRFVHPETGRDIERIQLPPGVRFPDTSPAVQLYNSSLIATGYGTIYRLNNAALAWNRIVQMPNDITTASSTLTDHYLVFRDVVRMVSAVDLETHKRLWSLPLEHYHQELLPAVHVGHGEIIVGTSEGRLVQGGYPKMPRFTCTVARRITTQLQRMGEHRIIFGTKGTLVAYDIT